jgi:hypothetical protein
LRGVPSRISVVGQFAFLIWASFQLLLGGISAPLPHAPMLRHAGARRVRMGKNVGVSISTTHLGIMATEHQRAKKRQEL